MVLARSFSHIDLICDLAFSASVSLISSSMYFPCLTFSTPVNPSEPSAPSMALPCGSRTPFFSVILIFAFMSVGFHQLRLRTLRQLTLAEDAEPSGDVLIGFDEAAEVAAEAILVELVVGFHVPQAAGI